jgi:hypothetical protein
VRWIEVPFHFDRRTILSLGFHCFESAVNHSKIETLVIDVGELWLKLWVSV